MCNTSKRKKKREEEFNRKLLFREKIRWLSLQPFLLSQTLPPKKWDKHQRSDFSNCCGGTASQTEPGCQGKGGRQVPDPVLPWFQGKAVPTFIWHVTHQLWLKGRSWQWGTQSPPFGLVLLPLSHVRKNSYKIHYNQNPRGLSTKWFYDSMKICLLPATAEPRFLTPIPPAILPRQGQEWVFFTMISCGQIPRQLFVACERYRPADKPSDCNGT